MTPGLAGKPAVCVECGSPLGGGSAGELCPACVLQLALHAHSPAPAAGWTPPEPAALAGRFPELEILELLGRGGMGAVYKARQKSLDRLVALKILPPAIEALSGFPERFAREAKALARLNHPHIVAIYDFGERAKMLFLIMEFVDGASLRTALAGGAMPVAEALMVVRQMCAALQYAHDHGVMHRDIKPENILIGRPKAVKITDFGLARLVDRNAAHVTAANPMVLGTPIYMAPEQLEHPADVDQRADVYSLGVVFYEMLTGELPLGRFPPPSQKARIDGRLDSVVLRALEKDPGRRYQRAGELLAAIQKTATASAFALLRPKAQPDRQVPELAASGGATASVFTPRPTYPYGSLIRPAAWMAVALLVAAVVIFLLMFRPPPSSVTSPHGWLGPSWSRIDALVRHGKTLFLAGVAKSRPRLVSLIRTSSQRGELSRIALPANYVRIESLAYGRGELLIGGQSLPSDSAGGARVVLGIWNASPAPQSLQDVTRRLPGLRRIAGIAYAGGEFLLVGTRLGGTGFLALLRKPPGRPFKGLFPIPLPRLAAPGTFRAALPLADGNFIVLATDEVGAKPWFGVVVPNGGSFSVRTSNGVTVYEGVAPARFVNLTPVAHIPAGFTLGRAAASDGQACLLQGHYHGQTALALYNPSGLSGNRLICYKKSLAVAIDFIAGHAGRFLLGGRAGAEPYLAMYEPAAAPHRRWRSLTTDLPAGARSVTAGVLDGGNIVVAGQLAQGRAFLAVMKSTPQ